MACADERVEEGEVRSREGDEVKKAEGRKKQLLAVAAAAKVKEAGKTQQLRQRKGQQQQQRAYTECARQR